MIKRFSKLRLLVMLIMIAIVIIPNITYADTALSQNNINTPSNWAKADIDKAKEINLVPKKIQGDYRSSITREEFSEVAVKLYELLSGKECSFQGKNPFTDTQNTQVLIAYQLGIVYGKGNGRFDPNSTINREEISSMLYRELKILKPEFNYSKSYEYIFTDYDSISSWAKEAVNYLYYFGVISGVGDNRFNPSGNTTREEAIVLAKRMHGKVLEYGAALNSSANVSRGGVSRQGDIRLKLASFISQEMGKPYKWGGVGPDSYDCSGLIYSIYGKLGIALPRTSSDQSKAGVYVSKESLSYGDLVFFAKDGKNVNHVGIYVGSGEFVHAPSSGDVVKTSTLLSGYYAKNYYTARKVLP
ncbi:NlpC/P60 family protein [Proteiniborus sp. MB09-C3]|uniref:NlpC/P60 family protein n=1 Tax=Proteiniborus sp. MB09-C3 TaxID=3050072 RepID=UPI0025546422|nr:NlpC/P60 family protein [Proteiniborus sp. MB09-C3]WIV12476.1 NlpC/P60 family protein [Proteiniborus sp. MB09-C3]